MTTLDELADRAARRLDISHHAAYNLAETYLAQYQQFDGWAGDPDNLPDDVAGFILGAIAAGADTTPPTILDDITDKADALAAAIDEVDRLRGERDQLILKAVDTDGRTWAEVQAASGLSHESVKAILRRLRRA